MKNTPTRLLLLLSCGFALLTAGFFAARSHRPTPVLLRPLPPLAAAPAQEADTEPININTATVDQLRTLPGIDAELAQQIVARRTVEGPFPSRCWLLLIPGMQTENLEAIWDMVTTGG